MSPILLLNCGSSSIKYQLIDTETEQPTAVGMVEKIGLVLGLLTHKVDGQSYQMEQKFNNHKEAIDAAVKAFAEYGPDLSTVVAVGHRTVHGGESFREPTIINDEVIATLVELSPLAPLHNPPGIAGIRAAQEVLPDVPHVGIFDTAFFSTLPAEAYTYAIDAEIAKKYKIRKYGFHGTSHSYVSKKAAEVSGLDYHQMRQIVCHLGNGASVSAIENGVAIETSMGLTPLAGLVMGTRSGDIDPDITNFLGDVGYSFEEIDTILNKKSGMFGLCGHTDMRDVEEAIAAGDEKSIIAQNVYNHRLILYVGAYMALLGGIDAITFTAGVGENSPEVRAA
ncbi:MAG: acetate kinase, partial [Propionibacterium sp.]